MSSPYSESIMSGKMFGKRKGRDKKQNVQLTGYAMTMMTGEIFINKPETISSVTDISEPPYKSAQQQPETTGQLTTSHDVQHSASKKDVTEGRKSTEKSSKLMGNSKPAIGNSKRTTEKCTSVMENSEQASKSTHVKGKPPQVTRNSEQVTRNSEQVTRNSEQVTRKLVHGKRNSDYVTVKSGHVTEKSTQVKQISEQVTGKSEQVTGKSEQVTGKSEQVTGKSSQGAENVAPTTMESKPAATTCRCKSADQVDSPTTYADGAIYELSGEEILNYLEMTGHSSSGTTDDDELYRDVDTVVNASCCVGLLDWLLCLLQCVFEE